MERLTYKEGNHYYSENDCLVEINTIDEDSLNVLQNVLDKLGAYEDAEEQGRILPAPLDGVERFSLDGGKAIWQRVYEPDMTEEGTEMNENEAIEVLKDFDKQVTAKADGAYQSTIGKMACDTAIKALEEVQRYRKIGTVEECRKSVEICKSMIGRNITPENMEEYMKFEDECISEGFTFNSLLEAREKQTAKRPGYSDGQLVYDTWICPCCGKHYEVDCDRYDYCPNCGQKIRLE